MVLRGRCPAQVRQAGPPHPHQLVGLAVRLRRQLHPRHPASRRLGCGRRPRTSLYPHGPLRHPRQDQAARQQQPHEGPREDQRPGRQAAGPAGRRAQHEGCRGAPTKPLLVPQVWTLKGTRQRQSFAYAFVSFLIELVETFCKAFQAVDDDTSPIPASLYSLATSDIERGAEQQDARLSTTTYDLNLHRMSTPHERKTTEWSGLEQANRAPPSIMLEPLAILTLSFVGLGRQWTTMVPLSRAHGKKWYFSCFFWSFILSPSFFVFLFLLFLSISANLSTVSCEGEASVFERDSGVPGATRHDACGYDSCRVPVQNGESNGCCTL
ncbi:hypothetical protein TPAR_01986 [Tolypocladium paradoxum]|uniref:Uncharacterized protein n=1 Tax=Tolypocladium paradoxum TaxID=94208 RepID=A0A2S4L5W0_9HYPO|nr:hypothetical protein TPAR_01986 [Tolypocladium paradoxum]